MVDTRNGSKNDTVCAEETNSRLSRPKRAYSL